MKNRLTILFMYSLPLLGGSMFFGAAAFAQQWATYTTANTPYLANAGFSDVRCIAFDANGNKWVGFSNGLAKFAGSSWNSYSDSLDQAQTVCMTFFGGDLWVSTCHLQKYDGTDWPFVSPNSNADCISSLATDNHAQIWVGTDAGLSVLRTNGVWNTYLSTQSSTNFPSDAITYVAADHSGNVWVAFNSQDGLVKMNGNSGNGIYISNTLYSLFPYGFGATSIAIDRSGNVWAGSDGSGVVQIHDTNVSVSTPMTVYSVETNAQFISDAIVTTAVDSVGNVWVGTSDNGAAYWDGKAWTIFNAANSPLPNNKVNAITVDAAGLVWLCTAGGLAEFTPPAASVAGDNGSNPLFALDQNYPNPFTVATSIGYSIPQREHVSLKIYDALGREVTTLRDGDMDGGSYSVPFDGSTLKQDGVYFSVLRAGGLQNARAMQLLR